MNSRKPKAVVLDGATLNPGDLSWKPLEAITDLEIYPQSDHNQVIERARYAEIILTNKAVVSAEVIDSAKALRLIAVTATGYNNVDITAASSRAIAVANVAGYGTTSVAQHVFAFILHFANRIGSYNRSVQQGDWTKSAHFSYQVEPITELSGQVLGIVGFGRIGRKVAELAKAFNMEVLVYSNYALEDQHVRRVSLESLFQEADFITLNTQLVDGKEHLVNERLLKLMKPTAYLINTARGALIDEVALRKALLKNEIGGAAVDVLSEEPVRGGNPLIGLPNCIITPHVAWASRAARQRLLDETVINVAAFLSGESRNLIS